MLKAVLNFPKSRFFGLFCAFSSGCFRAAICYLTHFMKDGNGFKVNLYTCILGIMYVKMWQLLTPKLDQLPFLLKNWKMWLLSGIMGSLSYTAAFQMFSYAPTSDAYSIFLGAELIVGIGVDYFILKVNYYTTAYYNSVLVANSFYIDSERNIEWQCSICRRIQKQNFPKILTINCNQIRC